MLTQSQLQHIHSNTESAHIERFYEDQYRKNS
jgi:hypothetical protein